MKQTVDMDEAFTYRLIEKQYPSKKLEEEVSATILRCAKVRFRRRNTEGASPVLAPPVESEPLSSDSDNASGTEDSKNEQDLASDHPSDAGSEVTSNAASQRAYQPIVATNDDVSYALIQPSTRSILQSLDTVLAILHNTRMASAQNVLDADASSSSEDEDLYNEATPSRRSRSRSRATSRATTDRSRSQSRRPSETPGDGLTPTRKSNRGRKPKLVPLEGESYREFLIRRAKIQKKKVPVFSNEELETGADTAAESANDISKKAGQRRSNRHERRPPGKHNLEYWQQKRLQRLNLRDWSDIMGAAALAGFSPKVIDRATQRCANLFGQGMEMHTIGDDVNPSKANSMGTKRYIPGDPVSSSSSEEEGQSDTILSRQARSISRHSSIAPNRAISLEGTSGGEGQERQSSRKTQKRSSSRGTPIAQHHCPHMDCERAITGFDRLSNLKRHLRLIHQDEEARLVDTTESKEEKLYGGVQIDGFLEPIRMQRGWRTNDTTTRARKSPQKKRLRTESVSESDN